MADLTFCVHRLHCRECHEQTTHLVRGWQEKVAKLQAQLDEALALLVQMERGDG